MAAAPLQHYTRTLTLSEQELPLSALTEYIARKPNPAVLGANPAVRGFSIFAAEPAEVLECPQTAPAPLEMLAAALSRRKLAGACGSVHRPSSMFCGGWIGWFAYDLCRFIEPVPAAAARDLPFPLFRLAFYDKAVVYDHRACRYVLTALAAPDRPQDAEPKFAVLADWLDRARSAGCPAVPAAPALHIDFDRIASNMTREQYFAALSRIRRYIRDGQTYQINLSRRLDLPFGARPVDLFHMQTIHNPAPFAALLAWEDKAVVSASPELFLSVCGNRILTRPIKGTRPRNPRLPDSHPENRAVYESLLQSEKDRAELAMIVDLERNDIARVCIPGTRRVSVPRTIESFATVYHAVADIEGTLRTPPGPGRVLDILRSLFPGGSITGAPKIRSMQIIDELEPTARSVYTGAIGYIGLDFDLCLNIAIRTVLIDGDRAHVQTGGGIVADSDPVQEWDETLTKARALVAAIGALNAAQKPV